MMNRFLAAFILCTTLLLAQGSQLGSTPPGVATGRPAGSFPLSGFDAVNPFTGRINARIPLLALGGRGSAQQPLFLPIEARWDAVPVCDPPPDPGVPCTPNSYTPYWNGWFDLTFARYTPGFVVARTGATFGECAAGTPVARTLTRVVFIQPDGTETELRDVLLNGTDQPNPFFCQLFPPPGANRGTTFVSADGSAMTFVASAAVRDLVAGDVFVQFPSGVLYLRDGTRYQVNEGTITAVQDRSGNQISFTYGATQLTATDQLGRTVTVTFNQDLEGPTSDVLEYRGERGLNRRVDVVYASLSDLGVQPQPLWQLWPGSAVNQFQVHNPRLVKEIVLPNGAKYEFRYNTYGELTRLQLPTGGVFEYDWANGLNGGAIGGVIQTSTAEGPRVMLYRRVTQKRSFATALTEVLDIGISCGSVPVTARDGTGAVLHAAVHKYSGCAPDSILQGALEYPPWLQGKEIETEERSSDTVTVLRRTTMTWKQRPPASELPGTRPENPRLAQIDTNLLDPGSSRVSRKAFLYDQYNNPTQVDDFDFGVGAPGPLLRRTITSYQTGGYDQVPAHLRNLPAQITVLNGSGTMLADTRNFYDAGALLSRFNVQGYAPPSTSLLGNPTSTQRWESGSTYLTTTREFDVLGNVTRVTDPRGFSLRYDYTDNCSANPLVGGLQSFALPTTITNQVSQVTKMQYDCHLGQPTRIQTPAGPPGDAGDLVTNVFYFDTLDRVTNVIQAGPPQRETSYVYDDTFNANSLTTNRDIGLGLSPVKSQTRTDGLGRLIESRQYESAGGYISVFREYQGIDRVFRVSNPKRLADPTVWTTNAYDTLGRLTSTTQPGFAVTTFTHRNDEVTIADPAGIRCRNKTDGLGRLVRVTENPDQVEVVTDYGYDALDNLLWVVQPGSSLCLSGGLLRTRSFTYDGLSRLRSACNPESAITNYTSYDGNGNLLSRTDARNNVTTYAYDGLNRPTSKTYAGAATASVAWSYDACHEGALCAVTGTTGTFQSSTAFSNFDTLGRPGTSVQTTGGAVYNFGYTYNLLDGIRTITYPSGRVVTYAYDQAGRPSTVSGNQSGNVTNYVPTAITYAPHGGITAMPLGARWESTVFNDRLQPSTMRLGFSPAGAELWQLQNTYGFAPSQNNGNVTAQTIFAGGPVYSVNYGYDVLNRLLTASEPNGWNQEYCYDAVGNRAQKDSTTLFSAANLVPTSTCTGAFTVPYSNRYQWTAAGHDPAGNQTTLAGRTYTFDAEGRITSAVGTPVNSLITFDYDGAGRRVRKTVGSSVTISVYDAMGNLAAEYENQPAVPQAPTIYFTMDHLGSTRVLTDAAGFVLRRYDYAPFGDEIPAGTNGRSAAEYRTSQGMTVLDAIKPEFTGKERDAETGLDYFESRYFSSAQGRFTSPDAMLAKKEWLSDPQRWNRYAYVRNNPLRYIDPNGEDLVVYTFYGSDLTDEQKKYLQANMKQIQANIAEKFKKAGVDKVEFRDGSKLTQKQIDKILANGSSTNATGVGLLNFANQKFSGQNAGSMNGATASDTRSVVFMKNVGEGLDVSTEGGAATMNFRMGEVGAHELGHGQSFESDGATWNFIKDLGGTRWGFGNLMGEGQGVPYRPKQFDPSQDRTQKAIREINRIGDNTPKP